MNRDSAGSRPEAGGLPGGLFTDLYELAMADALVADGETGEAEFELFFRDPGPQRGYVLLAGLEPAIAGLEQLHLTGSELDYLAGLQSFSEEFLDWLSRFAFAGDVEAIPEGSVVFAQEPLLRVRAPLPIAQIIETRLINALHHATLVATKAARIVDAADGRSVVDFGARRAHGHDAALSAARSAWIGGCAGTSNMVAGRLYHLPVVGTMAHSYVQAMGDELTAFRAFTRRHPQTVLLVDTYDAIGGVDNVIRLAREQGSEFTVQAIRIDSGDLAELARTSRRLLDEAGLEDVRIIVSGALNEHRIQALLASGAPIDGFGVGTDLVVSRDVPVLDFAYKLVSYRGRPTLKASPDKATMPGPKQVYRRYEHGRMVGDTITAAGDEQPGEPLLQPVLRAGRRTGPAESLAAIRERAEHDRATLPTDLRALQPKMSYPVTVSDELQAMTDRLRRELQLPPA